MTKSTPPKTHVCFSAQDFRHYNSAHGDIQCMRNMAGSKRALFVNGNAEHADSRAEYPNHASYLVRVQEHGQAHPQIHFGIDGLQFESCYNVTASSRPVRRCGCGGFYTF
jgi:hypothetical protein